MHSDYDASCKYSITLPLGYMFQSPGHVARRQGKFALSRLEYLQRLVIEYQESQDLSVQQQILANLCNFAYDPVNFQHLRALKVIPDLLLDGLSESDLFIVRFSLGGIANCCSDTENARLILDDSEGVEDIVQCLSSADYETVTHAMTILLLLLDPHLPWKKEDNISQFVELIQQKAAPCLAVYASGEARPVLSNLAQLILDRLKNPASEEEVHTPNTKTGINEQGVTSVMASDKSQ